MSSLRGHAISTAIKVRNPTKRKRQRGRSRDVIQTLENLAMATLQLDGIPQPSAQTLEETLAPLLLPYNNNNNNKWLDTTGQSPETMFEPHDWFHIAYSKEMAYNIPLFRFLNQLARQTICSCHCCLWGDFAILVCVGFCNRQHQCSAAARLPEHILVIFCT